jgi:hypothetical protein
VYFEKDGRLLGPPFQQFASFAEWTAQVADAQRPAPRVMTTVATLKMQDVAGKAGSNTYCVSLSSELPLKSRLEFVGRATADVEAPFVKVL